MIDDDEIEGVEIFMVSWIGVNPRVEPATFILTIIDNDGK